MAVPGTGTVTYGSGSSMVTFDGYIDSHISARPVYDEAKRTVTYISYSISINAKISGGAGTTDTTLEQWRKTLLTPALPFHYDNHGFGISSMTVNNYDGGAPLTDVSWGPLPELLDFKPLGTAGALVTWRVTVNIPTCIDGGGRNYNKAGKVVALNYDVSWDIDETGLTNRTIAGYIEIPMTRIATGKAGRKYSWTADQMRDEVTPPLMHGFKRSQRFKLSKDRRRLDFSFSDHEIEVPLPRNVIRCSASHNVDSSLSEGGLVVWKCSITADIAMARNVGKSQAYNRFLMIVKSRIGHIMEKVGDGLGDVGKDQNPNAMRAAPPKGLMAKIRDMEAGPKKSGATFIPLGWSITENLFDTSSHFEFRFQLSGTSLDEILLTSGMWKPIGTERDGYGFKNWQQTMTALWNNRGTALLKHKGSDDAIIDLCVEPPPPEPQSDKAHQMGGANDPQIKPPIPAAGQGMRRDRSRNPLFGWQAYENRLRYIEDVKVVRHKKTGEGALKKVGVDTYTFKAGEGKSGTDAMMTGASAIGNAIDQANDDREMPEQMDSGNVGAGALAGPASAKEGVGQQAGPAATEPDEFQTTTTPSVWVVMSGYGQRAYERVPVPALVRIGNVQAIQQHRNTSERLVANVAGIPIWETTWRIVYALVRTPNAGTVLPTLYSPMKKNKPGSL